MTATSGRHLKRVRTCVPPMMTVVIGRRAITGYRRRVAARDDVQHVAAVLRRPGAGYLTRVRTHAAAMAPRSGDAARQLALFADRLGDLTTPELQELHDETFGPGRAQSAAREAERLARQPPSPAAVVAALDVFVPLLERLDAERNPFALVVRALCCVLLARASRGPVTPATS